MAPTRPATCPHFCPDSRFLKRIYAYHINKVSYGHTYVLHLHVWPPYLFLAILSSRSSMSNPDLPLKPIVLTSDEYLRQRQPLSSPISMLIMYPKKNYETGIIIQLWTLALTKNGFTSLISFNQQKQFIRPANNFEFSIKHCEIHGDEDIRPRCW